MKKLFFVVGLSLLFTGSVHAVDLVAKRQAIVRKAEVAVRQYVDSLNAMKQLRDERAVSGNFLDSDFSSTTDLVHLDAGTVGTLFDFVVPSLDTNYQDTGNAGRNKDILLKMRK